MSDDCFTDTKQCKYWHVLKQAERYKRLKSTESRILHEAGLTEESSRRDVQKTEDYRTYNTLNLTEGYRRLKIIEYTILHPAEECSPQFVD